MEKYYTVKEVAELLEMSRYFIRKLIRMGWLDAKRGPRGMYLISEVSLFNYACHGPKQRALLSMKIGWRFNLYSNMRDTIIGIRNGFSKMPENLKQRIQEVTGEV